MGVNALFLMSQSWVEEGFWGGEGGSKKNSGEC